MLIFGGFLVTSLASLDLPRDLDSNSKCGPNSKFKKLKALESWQFVWKMNVRNEEDFRAAWEEGKKTIILIFECLDHPILINLLLHST